MGLEPGEIVDGKYRIVRLLGEGGMGAVYEGENTRIRRTVAIKVLHASVAGKSGAVRRFEREAQAAGTIGSEHIVEVLDLGSLPSGERYMVMEYLDGEDLTSRIRRSGRLSAEQVVPLLHQVLDGLAAAHDAGIIHRDLKPDNIYVLNNKAGRVDFVKLLDFGVSKFSALDTDMSMTKTGAVMGTPYYMSPEQAKGKAIDVRSDLYSIGVVLYQGLTGRVPFQAGSFNELLFKIALEEPPPIQTIVPDIPPSFAAIVMRAMHRDPDQRYQSARGFQAALSQWGMTHAPAAVPARSVMGSIPDASGSYPQAQMPTPQGYPTPGGGMNPMLSGSQEIHAQSHLQVSQAALSVTREPAGSNNSKVVIIALLATFAAFAAIVGLYLSFRTPPGGTAATGPSASAAGEASTAADASAPTAAAPSATDSAEPETTAEPSADPSASGSNAASAVVDLDPPTTVAPTPHPARPTPRPAAKPTAAPPPTAPPPTPAPSGPRSFSTGL